MWGTAGPVWNFSQWFTPGHFLRVGVINSPLGLVTVMSPLASVLRCIYWSEPVNYSLCLCLYFLVTMSFFSKSTRLFLFCKEVYLYPCLDSTESNILCLSFSISLTSLSIISRFFPAFFHPLRLSNIALCTHTPFSAFIHLSWTLQLLPCLGCCTQCCHDLLVQVSF